MLYLQKLEFSNDVVCNFATYSDMPNALIDPLTCLIMKEDYRKALKSLLRIKESSADHRYETLNIITSLIS